MSWQSARGFVAGVPELKSLPRVYERICSVVADRGSSAAQIGKVVSEDPGITARLLRLVNSSFYSFPGQIDTISRAVAMVGTDELCDLAAATCVIEAFRDVPIEFVDMRQYWRHSLACGLAARTLGRHAGVPESERLFVAGLLHDIGSVIVFSRAQSRIKRIIRRCQVQEELLHVAEQKVLGFDHAEVGYELLLAWRFPPALLEPVACHHHPSRARTFSRESDVVHVADVLVHAMELGDNGEHAVPPLDAQAWEGLELAPELLTEVVTQVDETFEAIEFAMLGNLPASAGTRDGSRGRTVTRA